MKRAVTTTAAASVPPLPPTNAPGTGLGRWIAGQLAHGLGLKPVALREEQEHLHAPLEFSE